MASAIENGVVDELSITPFSWQEYHMPTLITQKRHVSRISSLAWSPDGNLIVVGGYSDPKRKQVAPVVVWDASTGERRAGFRGMPRGAEELAWSPDGLHIAAVGWDASIRVWNWQTNQTSFEHAYAPSSWPNAFLAWSPDGRWLATAGRGTEITIWDATTWQAHHTYADHGQPGSGYFAWSPDGTRIASSGYDRTVRVWESATGRTLWTGPRESRHVAWSPDSRFLAAGKDRGVLFWDMRTFQLAHELEATTIGRSPELAWSPTGQYLEVSGNFGNWMYLWEPTPEHHSRFWAVRWAGGASWSPDGSHIACGCGVNTAQVWQVV
jgi:WD40 repeat protein